MPETGQYFHLAIIQHLLYGTVCTTYVRTKEILNPEEQRHVGNT